MAGTPIFHHRRSIRLKGYNYSQAGLYFVTICVKNRACLFGEIRNRKMELNNAGQMVKTEWVKLPERFKNIRLHEYIVMPNHFHAILGTYTFGHNQSLNIFFGHNRRIVFFDRWG